MRTLSKVAMTQSAAALLLMSAAAASAQTERSSGPDARLTQVASAAPAPAPTGFSQSAAARDALHVVVGRSIFLDTIERVRRVYIANPLVVDSYTANPHEIVLTSKAPGTSSVILWDELGHTQSYLVSADVDVEDLALSMKRAMPAEDVQIHSRENHIVLTGTVSSEAKSDAAAKLAALYSKDVTNSLAVNRALIKQVRLKVRIIEVDRSKMDAFGFNFFGQGGTLLSQTTTQQYPSNPTYTPPTTTTPGTLTVSDALNFLLFSSKLNVGATLKDLENKQVLQILAEPNITTLSGEKANFLSGGEFPFPVIQGSSGGLTSITIQFRSYGVKVEFTPVVNADGTIELKVAPEVSALDYTNSVTISGYTIPALSTRKVDTQVTVNSGQSFAISGLLDKRTTDLFANTPGISNVPVLGMLFRSKSTTHSNTELVIVVTPEVVEPVTHPVPPAEPKTIIPPLVSGKFDKSLPREAHAILDQDTDSK
jgi:pilus assembly protein CpaC